MTKRMWKRLVGGREVAERLIGDQLSEEELRVAYADLFAGAVRLCNAHRWSYGGPETLWALAEKVETAKSKVVYVYPEGEPVPGGIRPRTKGPAPNPGERQG